MKLFVYDYIDKIKKEDIYRAGISQGIELEDFEVEVIFSYVKNDYKRFFNNPLEVIDEIKYKVNARTYEKIYSLYLKYKDMISLLK